MGPTALSFPTVFAPIRPSDSLIPMGRRYGLPSRAAYLDADALSLRTPSGGVRPAVRASTCARRVGEGSPGLRCTGRQSRKDEGLPGSWAVPFVHAVPGAPRRVRPLQARSREVASAFRGQKLLGTRDAVISGLHVARPTRSHAYASPAPLP